MSAKFTVFRGVVRVARLRLSADRVMSCNWRPELVRDVRDETSLECRGVKKRVKRLGVIGGGRFGFREFAVPAEVGGGDEQSSGVGSWMRMLRGAQGDDMLLYRRIYICKTPMDS